MNKNSFSEEEIEKLSENKYVKHITNKTISFTREFKEHFIKESKTGKGPTRIFIESNLNPYIIGPERIKGFSKRIKKKYKTTKTLDDNRGKKSTGRPKKASSKELTDKEKIEHLEHENLMLKAENELLKKMEFLITQKELKNSQQKKDFK